MQANNLTTLLKFGYGYAMTIKHQLDEAVFDPVGVPLSFLFFASCPLAALLQSR
jgi:hypothetical protein